MRLPGSVLLCLCLCLCLGLAAYGDDSAQFTGGYRNGRFWIGKSLEVKVVYIVGLKDGIRIGGTENAQWGKILTKCRCTTGELIKGIDAFYSDSVLLKLPVIAAVHVYAERASGATKGQLDELARGYLRDFSVDTGQ